MRGLSVRHGRIGLVRVAVVPGPGRAGLLCPLDDQGGRAGVPVAVDDLAAAIRERERAAPSGPAAGHGTGGTSVGTGAGGSAGGAIRWVWFATAALYPALARADAVVTRCHDVSLTEALLRTRDAAARDGGRGTTDALRGTSDASAPGEPPRDASWQRLLDYRPGPVEPDGGYRPDHGYRPDSGPVQPALFDPDQVGAHTPADPGAALDALIEVHASQLIRIAADPHPARFALLVAAESAGALAAVEMSLAGLPWRADVHDSILTGMLGARPPAALGATGRLGSPQGPARPRRLTELAAQISAALGTRQPVNPDSPGQLTRALAAAGIRVPSTRLAALREVDHPAIPPLVEYKELARLHSAFGWAWLDTWVANGRFRPEYVVGGVVSGRWASRGGGALQIPRLLRRAVVADPGWVLVVADAAQLEPRVLAALAGDRAFAAAAAAGDLYSALASHFGGDRAKAKVAMLSAMYGGAGGEAGQLLAVLRQRFPAAAGFVEAAAQAGQEGRTVRSALGRTCPPPSARWRAMTEEASDPDGERDPQAGLALRARGRFTRNFVVQASAADWALVMLARLRARLATIPAGADGQASGPELVFFQHDEVIVHCPRSLADDVAATVSLAAADATRLVFGPTPVVFPLSTAVVECYADAK